MINSVCIFIKSKNIVSLNTDKEEKRLTKIWINNKMCLMSKESIESKRVNMNHKWTRKG